MKRHYQADTSPKTLTVLWDVNLQKNQTKNAPSPRDGGGKGQGAPSTNLKTGINVRANLGDCFQMQNLSVFYIRLTSFSSQSGAFLVMGELTSTKGHDLEIPKNSATTNTCTK